MTPKDKVTTIKLQKETKQRLEKLRSYKRESYDEILQKLLETLNVCRLDPQKAQARLRAIDRKYREITAKKTKKVNKKVKPESSILSNKQSQ